MSESTIIAWTDHTANFWMGCSKVSPGCEHCYAETLTTNRMGLSVWGPKQTTRRQAVKGIYANLRKWNRESDPAKPARVFVGSLMDWAEDHPDCDALRPAMWEAIRENDRLVYQMLTKRPERIQELLPSFWEEIRGRVWLGASVEDQKRAELRLPSLLSVAPRPAVNFVSYEPALGAVDFSEYLFPDLNGYDSPMMHPEFLDWIIVGGESGPGFRPMPHEWARAVRDNCRAAGVAFFFKQSAAIRTEIGTTLDGETVREYPVPRVFERPAAALLG
jgi:protein gp37